MTPPREHLVDVSSNGLCFGLGLGGELALPNIIWFRCVKVCAASTGYYCVPGGTHSCVSGTLSGLRGSSCVNYPGLGHGKFQPGARPSIFMYVSSALGVFGAICHSSLSLKVYNFASLYYVPRFLIIFLFFSL